MFLNFNLKAVKIINMGPCSLLLKKSARGRKEKNQSLFTAPVIKNESRLFQRLAFSPTKFF